MRDPALAALILTGLLLFSPLGATSGSTGSPAVAPTVPGAPSSAALVAPTAPVGSGLVEVAPAYAPNAGVGELGPVEATTPLDVAVGLAISNASNLSAYLTALYVPGTPAYHAFLSDSELSTRFGASRAAIARASAYFASFGLRVTASPDHLLLDVEGPAAEVGPAFGTTFDLYRSSGGPEFVSHPTPATLPAGYGWTGALGLGNDTPILPAVTSASTVVPVAGPAASCSATGDVVPCQVWGAYDMSTLIGSGTDGAGETIGVVDAYDAAEPQTQLESDLASFDSATGLATPTVNYLYPVPTTGDLNATTTEWGGEEALDLEWSHASAPGATIDMTFSPNPEAGLYEAVDYLVAHQSVNVLSMSWGEPDVGVFNRFSTPCSLACNASTDGSYALLGPVLEFAAAEGISVFAASGDCGAADGTNGVSTNFPASDPYVTGVGGTVLSVSPSGTWEGETAWSGNSSGRVAPGCDNEGGSGGGYSPLPRPWWQVGDGTLASEADRGVPDVSAISLPGVLVYIDGSPGPEGGTSLATPIWAGIAAISDQYAGSPRGLLNPSLYSILEGPDYGVDFHDIVSGTNGYSAGTGWDPISGIGTPIVGNLVADLTAGPTTLPSLYTELNVSSESGPAPLTVRFFVNATGGTGSTRVEGVYFGDGNASFATDGLVTHTYPSPGFYVAQSYVADLSGNLSVSLPIAIVVGGGSSLRIDLAVSSTTPSVGAPVTLTATPTGGTGPYSYLYYFGDGTYENWTLNPSVVHVYGTSGSYCPVVVAEDAASPPNGGVSVPVGLGVGSAPTPVCAAPVAPLVVTASSAPAARDAPADFPALFTVSGGGGTRTEQYVSSDPYVAACECAIFRAPGTYPISLYVNDSAGPPARAETNVTVAPALAATFTATPPIGPAPLTVHFAGTVSGGDGAAPASVTWTFGNGASATGESANETYTASGTYWAVGQVADAGYGNASEAFLVNVGPSTPSAAPYVSATIAPAVQRSSGETVEYSAEAFSWNGTATAANFTWQLGNGRGGFTSVVNQTSFAPGPSVTAGNLSATFATTGTNVTVPFSFAGFFAVEGGGFVPRASAILLDGTGGPSHGPAPLTWQGSADAVGPGTPSIAWTLGDGTSASGPSLTHRYGAPGRYTVTLTTGDAWGDRAVDPFAVDVTNATAAPLAVESGPSVATGAAPLAVEFTAVATGGGGGPYSYDWEFGDGANSSAANVSHTYRTAGTYSATLTVRDARNGSLVRSYEIVVTPAPGGPPLGFLPRVLGVLVLGTAVVVGVVLALAHRRRPRPEWSASP